MGGVLLDLDAGVGEGGGCLPTKVLSRSHAESKSDGVEVVAGVPGEIGAQSHPNPASRLHLT